MFDLQLPLTCKTWTTLSNLTNKVRGLYFYKEVFLRLCHCVRLLFIASVWCCMNMYMRMQHYNNQQKKNICKIVDFAVPANHRIKVKECEKRNMFLDLARELKKLWNMKVTIISIVISAFGTVTKGLLKGLEDLEVGDRVETIQTTALLKTARILRRVLETWGDLLSLNLQWNTISLRWCEKLSWVNNNTHKHLWDFDIQTDHLISARRPDLIVIYKEK